MNNEFDIFKDFLKHHQLRWTPQRKLILEVFLQQEGHVPIEELHKNIHNQDSTIGIATLYRTMKLLVEAGLAQSHHFDDGVVRYEIEHAHHDHPLRRAERQVLVRPQQLRRRVTADAADGARHAVGARPGVEAGGRGLHRGPG